MRNILLIETLSEVFGGQKMSMLVSDMLRNSEEFRVVWAIPSEGPLSKALRDRGYTIYHLGDLSLPAGVKGMSAVVKYSGMSFRAIRRLLNIIHKENIDIIYAPGPASLPWAAFCGAMRKKPVVWHIHHIFEDGMTKRLLDICSRFPYVKSVIAVSKSASQQITNSVFQHKVAVLYNPIDYARYSSGKRELLSKYEPFLSQISGECPIIIEQIGLIHESKKQEFTIDLVDYLFRNGENAYGILIGNASEDGKQYQAFLKERMSMLGLQNRVFFVGQQNNVQDWLKWATAVAIPSVEGLSLVAMEAMAAEVLVIAIDKYGVGEIVRENNAGLLFDGVIPGDKLLKLLNEPQSLAEICKNGIKFAKQNDLEQYSKRIVSLFEAVIN